MCLIPILIACSLLQSVIADRVSPSPLHLISYSDPQPLLIYFNAYQCPQCQETDALFKQPEFLQKMEQHYVTVSVSIDDNVGKACADIYNVRTIPAIIIADYKGIILYKSDETLSVQEIELLFNTIQSQDVTSAKQPNPTTDIVITTPVSALLSDESPELNHNAPVLSGESEESLKTPSVVQEGVMEDNMHNSLQNSQQQISDNLNLSRQEVEKTPAQNVDNTSGANTKRVIVGTSKTVDHSHVDSKENPRLPVEGAKAKFTSSSTAGSNKTAQTRTTRTYAIQLGYFSLEPNAQTLMLKARHKGLAEVYTQTEIHDGISYYRVLVGKYPTLAEAQSLLTRVNTLGLKGAVYRK